MDGIARPLEGRAVRLYRMSATKWVVAIARHAHFKQRLIASASSRSSVAACMSEQTLISSVDVSSTLDCMPNPSLAAVGRPGRQESDPSPKFRGQVPQHAPRHGLCGSQGRQKRSR